MIWIDEAHQEVVVGSMWRVVPTTSLIVTAYLDQRIVYVPVIFGWKVTVRRVPSSGEEILHKLMQQYPLVPEQPEVVDPVVKTKAEEALTAVQEAAQKGFSS